MTTTTATIPTNGATTFHRDGDWRNDAMGTALLRASEDGSPLFALIGAFHAHRPDATCRVFWENRARTLDALGRHLTDFAPILTPALRHDSEDHTKVQAVLGWWRGRSAAGEFDVVLAPDFYGDGDFLIAGPTADATNALVSAVIEDATANTGRCLRYTGGWNDAPEMQAEIDKIGWDEIVLAPEMIADIRKTIDAFFAQKQTFERLGFPWRRGVLLIGPPGTGKTMVCKAAAASHPEIPFLYVRDLNSNRDAINDIFTRARRLAPCILAFEDIDGLVGRDNRTVFLNELDGFRNNDGVLIIASSNHPEKIDEALLKRPSRFDRVYHIGLPALAERTEYSRRLLAKIPHLSPELDIDRLSAQVAAVTEGFTPAFLKEAFLSGMLQMAHEGLTTFDDAFGAAVLEQIDTLRKFLKKAKNPEAMADLIDSSTDSMGFRR